ncbi:MAG: GNAT family N-acetyltransferase [Dehalococcoidia bacterium]
MNYREATRDDTLAIATLHAESWQVAYRGAYSDDFLDGPVLQDRIAVWERRMSSPRADRFVVLAEDGGEIAGFACAYGADDERRGTLLDKLHVRRDLHRRGVGARLISEIAKWCIANYPGTGLYLGVLEQNASARAFYERLGATDVEGFVDSPPGGGQVNVRRYAWAVEQLPALGQ